MGHDHVYTRSVMMQGLIPTEYADYTPNYKAPSQVTDPAQGEVLYLTVNSASGSKYYDIANYQLDYVAVKVQEHNPNITKIDVSDNALTFTTYRTGENNKQDDIVDIFTINRDVTTNSYNKPAISNEYDKDLYAPTLTVPSDNQIFVGDSYDVMNGVSASDYNYKTQETLDLISDIKVNGAVDTTKSGVYILTYTVTDNSNNTTTKDVTVTVKDSISLVTDKTIWKYLDNNTDPSSTLEDAISWTIDSSISKDWNTGLSPFGNNKGSIETDDGYIANTLLNLKDESDDTNIKGYFFKSTFNINDISLVEELNGSILFDDEATIYINGNEVTYYVESTRPKMIDYNNLWYSDNDQITLKSETFTISESSIGDYLKDGENTIAIELHNNEESEDVYVDLISFVATMSLEYDSNDNEEDNDLDDNEQDDDSDDNEQDNDLDDNEQDNDLDDNEQDDDSNDNEQDDDLDDNEQDDDSNNETEEDTETTTSKPSSSSGSSSSNSGNSGGGSSSLGSASSSATTTESITTTTESITTTTESITTTTESITEITTIKTTTTTTTIPEVDLSVTLKIEVNSELAVKLAGLTTDTAIEEVKDIHYDLTINKYSDLKMTNYGTKHWGRHAVSFCIEQGYFDGVYGSKNEVEVDFGTEDNATRLEIVRVLANMVQDVSGVTYDGKFSDVLTDSEGSNAIAWAVENGITTGTGDGTTFSPNDTVTRQQMAIFFARFVNELGLELPELHEEVVFKDADSIWNNTETKESIRKLQQAGIIQGYEGNFSPEATITRAQFATMVENLVTLLASQK